MVFKLEVVDRVWGIVAVGERNPARSGGEFRPLMQNPQTNPVRPEMARRPEEGDQCANEDGNSNTTGRFWFATRAQPANYARLCLQPEGRSPADPIGCITGSDAQLMMAFDPAKDCSCDPMVLIIASSVDLGGRLRRRTPRSITVHVPFNVQGGCRMEVPNGLHQAFDGEWIGFHFWVHAGGFERGRGDRADAGEFDFGR